MKESLKVFLACFIGGFIGTAVALQLGLFWWLGLILGGFVGYLAYEFKAVIQACKAAWQAVIRIRITKRQRRKFGNYLKIYFRAWFSLAAGAYGTAWIGVGLLLGFLAGKCKGMDWGTFGEVTMWAILLVSVFCLGLTRDEGSRKELLRYNLVRVYLWLLPKYIFLGVVCLIKLIIHAPKLIAKAAKTIAKFAKHVFIEIHSDERLLCGIDAAIGVAIGWAAGNALVGGFSGGLFGVLNYEVISKRILHLAPKRN